MGVGARYVRVNERWPTALPAVLNGGFADGIAFQRVGPIAFRDVQARETAGEFRDAAARGLDFDRNGNGVAVVFNEVDQREFFSTRGVQGLPEFAFAGGPVARRDEHYFLGLVAHVLAEGRFLGLSQSLRMILVVQRGFGGTDRLPQLRACAGRLVDDVRVGQAPVRWHLAAAGAGIVLGAGRLKEQ